MEQISTRDNLLTRIDAFLKENGIGDAKFGWDAKRDSSLVKRLREGGDVTTAAMDAINVFMDNYEPKEKSNA